MIDYGKIAKSIAYYQALGYEYVDAPWLVSKEAMSHTTPSWAKRFQTFNDHVFLGELVASGEQSFLYIRENLKERGKYVCATPCFRAEPNPDELHRREFFKVELIHVQPKMPLYSTEKLLTDAWGFFKQYWPTDVVKTEIGKDLFIGDVEVGSYGFREIEGFNWIYGTGCAEPRLTQALQRVKKK